jgi:hypothetical protein
MLSQLRLFDLAVIFNIAKFNFSISCKNKCYILINLQNYLKNSNFTVKLTPSIYNNLLFLIKCSAISSILIAYYLILP